MGKAAEELNVNARLGHIMVHGMPDASTAIKEVTWEGHNGWRSGQ